MNISKPEGNILEAGRPVRRQRPGQHHGRRHQQQWRAAAPAPLAPAPAPPAGPAPALPADQYPFQHLQPEHEFVLAPGAYRHKRPAGIQRRLKSGKAGRPAPCCIVRPRILQFSANPCNSPRILQFSANPAILRESCNSRVPSELVIHRQNKILQSPNNFLTAR